MKVFHMSLKRSRKCFRAPPWMQKTSIRCRDSFVLRGEGEHPAAGARSGQLVPAPGQAALHQGLPMGSVLVEQGRSAAAGPASCCRGSWRIYTLAQVASEDKVDSSSCPLAHDAA